MTVAIQSNRRDYSGNGSTQDFSVPFELFSSDDLKVYRRDETDPDNPTETLLVLSTDYSLTGADPLTGIICTGIHTAAAPTVTQKIVILRELDPEQGLDFNENGPFPVDDNEEALDRGVMLAQQLQEQIDRCVKVTKTMKVSLFDPTLPAEIKGQAECVIGTNSDGSGLKLGPTFTDIANAQGYGQAAIDAAASAASSQTAAATSATNAAASATAAAGSATAAAASASAAATSETNALGAESACSSSAAAASTSATNAATSASSASTSASNASTGATAAAASATAAAGSATSAATSATNAAASAAAAAASAGSFGLVVAGAHNAPSAITAAGGIPATTAQRNKRYIQGSGGAVDVTANPQIAAGTNDGDELTLVGCSDTNTVLLENGTGLIMNGPYTMKDGSLIKFNWDAVQSLWLEEYRNDL